MKELARGLAVVALALALGPAQASAQTAGGDTFARGGLRAGVGLDPDQLVLGGQLSLGRWSVARIVPSVDLGFGDSVTTLDFNGDFFLRVAVPDADLSLYGGGGPTLAYIDPDSGNGKWEVGLSLVLGGRLPVRSHRMNLEARFGVGDIPEFRLMLGFLF